ncbi:MAG: hypothetical protein V1847_01710 [Candidatus Diapherotrites archaeon]
MSWYASWKVWLMVAVVLLSIFSVFYFGLNLGIDFKGGTSFQIHLAEPVVDQTTKDKIRSTIQTRLDFSGLKGSNVNFVGDQLVTAELPEVNPEEIERLQTLLLRQGKFEVTLDGNLLFSGADVIEVVKDSARGYTIVSQGNLYRWTLPFILNNQGARSFTDGVFHKCTASGFSGGTATYDCPGTYFFIDRPSDSILVSDSATRSSDLLALAAGNQTEGIAVNTSLETVIQNVGVPYIVLDGNLSPANVAQLQSLSSQFHKAIIPATLSTAAQKALTDNGFVLTTAVPPQNIPFVWYASGVREVITLNETVTNQDPYVPTLTSSNLQVYSNLVITGTSQTSTDAQASLKSLSVLLESGSLPVAVDNVSRETVSPTLGKGFFLSALLVGLMALVAVAVVLYLRYRVFWLVIPMMITVICEVIVIGGIAAALRVSLDLAAIAGIVAAVGPGVDDQIVITDEFLHGKKEEAENVNLVQRAKRAFFVIFASATTGIATMFPLLIMGPGFGLGKLVGFAITTMIGILVGVLLTRQAFQEFAKEAVQKYKMH